MRRARVIVTRTMQRAFHTFIGVDLGGGKGKTTAVARLRLCPEGGGVVVDDFGSEKTWYDDQLVAYLLAHAGEAVVAVDVPLTLSACVRCTLPTCPGASSCEVPVVRWFRERAGVPIPGIKPRYTPYTQRAAEVLLQEEHQIQSREALGQGMGPLASRGVYLRRALATGYVLNRDLLEVYPRATLAQLFPDLAPEKTIPSGVIYRDGNGQQHSLRASRSRIARHYKRSGHAIHVRENILSGLHDLHFGPGQWREFALQNDHRLDALLCAYTAFLWARDGWQMPQEAIFAEDGWIWFPPRKGQT